MFPPVPRCRGLLGSHRISWVPAHPGTRAHRPRPRSPPRRSFASTRGPARGSSSPRIPGSSTSRRRSPSCRRIKTTRATARRCWSCPTSRSEPPSRTTRSRRTASSSRCSSPRSRSATRRGRGRRLREGARPRGRLRRMRRDVARGAFPRSRQSAHRVDDVWRRSISRQGPRGRFAYLTWVNTCTGSPSSKLSGTNSFSGSPLFCFENSTEICGAPATMGSRLRNRRCP